MLDVKTVNEVSWSPPKWIYRNRRPPDDDAYFENMIRVIFLGGLSWKTIDKKWINFKKAFNNFSIDEVAKFNKKDVQRLISDVNIVRNRAKIIATINNAKQFQNIRNLHGSFQCYLDSLDKSNNYIVVVNEICKKFSRMASSSARIETNVLIIFFCERMKV